jgi:hypothetical protein
VNLRRFFRNAFLWYVRSFCRLDIHRLVYGFLRFSPPSLVGRFGFSLVPGFGWCSWRCYDKDGRIDAGMVLARTWLMVCLGVLVAFLIFPAGFWWMAAATLCLLLGFVCRCLGHLLGPCIFSFICFGFRKFSFLCSLVYWACPCDKFFSYLLGFSNN